MLRGRGPHSKVWPLWPQIKFTTPIFNRSTGICYCISRIAGASLSVVSFAPAPIYLYGPPLAPVLAFLRLPLNRGPAAYSLDKA